MDQDLAEAPFVGLDVGGVWLAVGMSISSLERHTTPGSPGDVLACAREARAAELAAGVNLLVAAVEWASMHEPVPGDEAGWLVADRFVPIAGDGAPLVGEFAVAEFAAAVGMTTDAGKVLVGQAVELAHRLPKLWSLVGAGRVPGWQARRVADKTMSLCPEAAGFVDAQVAGVVGKIGVAQLDRLVEEAKRRHMPLAAQWPDDPDSVADGRGVWFDHDQVSIDGLVQMRGSLDLADALDLHKPVAVTAEQLLVAGSTEGLGARQAAALGELARNQLSLVFDQTEGDEPRVAPRSRRNDGRPVTLYLHLSEEALAGGGVGRCENTRSPIDAGTIREWCAAEGVTLTVKPVIDLAEHVQVGQYEVPDRLKELVGLRDVSCVFPWCSRPARSACDHDHAIPFADGGSTCSCNVAALCRHHHRLKTHTPWTYWMPEPGVYVWTSPHGYVFVRDRAGTTDVTPGEVRPAPACTATTASDPPDR